MSAHVVLVSAGVGPPAVRRFVGLLGARLEAVSGERGLLVREILAHGDEAEPWSVELVVEGDAPRLLAGELGTHALVARDAERGRASRKRWFAGVSIHPLAAAEDGGGERLDPRDLEISATTAGGPGGQHVNKTATAVRVRHRPSGIVVRVSDERSQRANLRRALDRIAERLALAGARRRAEGEAARRMAHYRFERGAPVRTYRLGARGALEG
jgi:peptide chain release factor 2/peptide chain release factor